MMEQEQADTVRLQIRNFSSLIYEQQALVGSEKSKQELLKAEIYDQYLHDDKILNLFCDYLIAYTKKVKGFTVEEPDLTLFTLDELRQATDTFKLNLSAIRSEKEKTIKQLRPRSTVSSILRDEYPRFKTFYKNYAWDYEYVLPILQCNREKHFFDSRSSGISIKFVNHFFKRSKGFFGIGGEMMLWIEIETAYLGKKIKVARNMHDFFFLEKTLQNIFPHSFIHPLRTSKDDMNSMDCMTQASVKKMISQCFSFLCKLSKREDLLENVFTFRFLVEEKPQNYIEHKLNNDSVCVDGLSSFKNIEGKVSANVSEKAERAKKQFMSQSGHFEKIWRNIGNIMSFASKSSKELSKYLEDITDQLNLMGKQLAPATCEQFAPFSKLISVFEGIIHAYGENIRQSDAVLIRLKQYFVNKSQDNWQLFNDYKARIDAASIKYQQRRKEFLEGEAMKLMEPALEKTKINKADLKIQFLNLQGNPLEEEWYLTETAWYGYLNHEFMTTFEDFVRWDRQRLQHEFSKMKHDIDQRMREGGSQIHAHLKSMGDDRQS